MLSNYGWELDHFSLAVVFGGSDERLYRFLLGMGLIVNPVRLTDDPFVPSIFAVMPA
jgi:hypothetical protein